MPSEFIAEDELMDKEEKALTRTEPSRLVKETSPPSLVKSVKSGVLILSIVASLIANIITILIGSPIWPLFVFWLPLVIVAIYHRFKVRSLQSDWSDLHKEVEKLKEWQSIAGKTGLVGCVKKLQESTYNPRMCMESEVDRDLDFMGHGASKWTGEPRVLDTMLKRIFEGDGRARFLILDPQCDSCKQVSKVQHGDENSEARFITESLMVFKPLKEKYENHLEIKLYDHRPQFRLTFIDHKKVVVGHYRANLENSKDSPLHVYMAEANWSFFTAFRIHFEDEWHKAKAIDWTEIEALNAQISHR